MKYNDYFGGFLLLYLFGIAILFIHLVLRDISSDMQCYAAMHVYFVNLFFPQTSKPKSWFNVGSLIEGIWFWGDGIIRGSGTYHLDILKVEKLCEHTWNIKLQLSQSTWEVTGLYTAHDFKCIWSTHINTGLVAINPPADDLANDWLQHIVT